MKVRLIPNRQNDRAYAVGSRYGLKGALVGGAAGLLISLSVYLLFNSKWLFLAVPALGCVGFYLRRIVRSKRTTKARNVLW